MALLNGAAPFERKNGLGQASAPDRFHIVFVSFNGFGTAREIRNESEIEIGDARGAGEGVTGPGSKKVQKGGAR